MKKAVRIFIPLLLVLVILASVAWYLFVYDREFTRDSLLSQARTLIKEGASLGANCTIICGHTIGRCALIAAGAVVTKDVKDYALMSGVPARQIGWVCECGLRLGDDLKCQCGRVYMLDGECLKKKL